MTQIDQQHLRAAEGWLELGDTKSAFEELENITPENRAHPEVLCLRWDIFTHAGVHGSAEVVARSLTQAVPDKFEHWWQLASSLHELGRTQEAYDTLSGVIGTFGGEWMLHYYLAIFLCRLRRLDEARIALNRTFELNPDHRRDALGDPELEPLWTENQRKSPR